MPWFIGAVIWVVSVSEIILSVFDTRNWNAIYDFEELLAPREPVERMLEKGLHRVVVVVHGMVI